MRKVSVISLIVVALGVGMAMERPAQGMYGDILVMAAAEPSTPAAPVVSAQADPLNVWVPAENVVATWESLTAMSKLSNPAVPGAKTTPERSLSIAARVDVVDVNGLLGFDYNAQGTLVLDEALRGVYSKAVPSRFCHFYWPLRYIKKMPTPGQGQWVNELQPYKFTVDMPIDPNRPYPLVLSRVEWSMYALVNTESKTVDVPFSVSADWVTLVPGAEIKVEQVTSGAGTYQYRISHRHSRSTVLWAPIGAAIALWTFDPTPEVIVTSLDILDAQGKSLREGGSSATGGSSSGGGAGAGGSGTVGDPGDLITAAAEPTSDIVTGTMSGTGSYSGGGTATTFRFTLALKPLQQQLRCILENVPVPSF